MKGKLFVCIYSIVLLGLFGACCYLMTTVNPGRLAGNETRKYHSANDMFPGGSLLPRANPDYGLEKIPEGVDADEFRKNYMKKVTKYELEADDSSYEHGKRVVPPIWPSDDVDERNVEKPKNKVTNSNQIETTSPIKGHRRSINDNIPYDVKEGPASILLKILDGSRHKKIEIKFISGENPKTKKLRRNRSSNQLKSNVICKNISKIDQNMQYKDYDDVNDKVIQIKPNDVILLHVVDDSDIFVEKSVLYGSNDTNDMQEMDMNTTDINYVNKSSNKETKLSDLETADIEVNDTMHDTYTFSLHLNYENSTIDSRHFETQEYFYTSKPFIATKSFNDASLSV